MTYEYVCQKCATVLVAEQRITDPPLTECEVVSCGGALRRLISGSGNFQLRGKGWYKTGGY